jgi:hypothetical protein
MTILSMMRQLRQSVLSIDEFFWKPLFSDGQVGIQTGGEGWRVEVQVDVSDIGGKAEGSEVGHILGVLRKLNTYHRMKIWFHKTKLVYDVSLIDDKYDLNYFDMRYITAHPLIIQPECCTKCSNCLQVNVSEHV